MWLTKKWWFLIVVIPIVGLCIKAGFWQLDRAHQKEELIRVLTVGESVLTSGSDMLSHQVQRRNTSSPADSPP